MPRKAQIVSLFLGSVIVTGCFAGAAAAASANAKTPLDTKEPTNDGPNPYMTIEHWAKLPDGRKMGSTSAVDIDKDGVSVWVAERCGANSCLEPQTREIKKMDVIFKFDTNGNVLKSLAAGCSSLRMASTWTKTITSGSRTTRTTPHRRQAAAARDAAHFNREAWTLLREQRLVTRYSNSAPMESS